jgi:hypothetical protein
MVHKIGQNLIFNSAPCQHFILSFSVAYEPALAFPFTCNERRSREKTLDQCPLLPLGWEASSGASGRFLMLLPPSQARQGLVGCSLGPKESHIRKGLVTFPTAPPALAHQ